MKKFLYVGNSKNQRVLSESAIIIHSKWQGETELFPWKIKYSVGDQVKQLNGRILK